MHEDWFIVYRASCTVSQSVRHGFLFLKLLSVLRRRRISPCIYCRGRGNVGNIRTGTICTVQYVLTVHTYYTFKKKTDLSIHISTERPRPELVCFCACIKQQFNVPDWDFSTPPVWKGPWKGCIFKDLLIHSSFIDATANQDFLAQN